MDERVTRRNSLWEAENGSLRNSRSGKEYYSSHDAGHSRKYLSSKADNNLLIPKDQAYASERMYGGALDEQEIREKGLNKNYYKNLSPGYDGWDRRKHNDSRDEGWIHSHRSRSRSRSRDRGRSRSRSQSRGRGRRRDRHSLRSRSRSPSRSKNPVRGRTRSRSPFHDRRREPHGSNDKIGSRVSSSICRDLAAGNCRRGSQCRFLHADITDGASEDDLTERWKGRSERGLTMRPGEERGLQSWDKVTDSNYGDDNSRPRSRGAILCKNYVRGHCQWGASCGFSHDNSGDNIVKDVGNSSFGHDRGHQRSDKGKPACKYFQVGKCNRENCWFSHDNSAGSIHEKRSYDEGNRSISSIKSGAWNGPTWDQIQSESDNTKGTGWGDHIDANESSALPSGSTKDKWAPEGKTWQSPEWKDKPSNKSSFISTYELNVENSKDLGATASKFTGNSNDLREHSQISPGLNSTKLGDISTGSHARNLVEEDSSHHLTMANMHATDVSMKSDTEQNDMAGKDNLPTFSYGGLGAVNETRSSMNSEFMARHVPSQNGIGNLDVNEPLVSNDVRDDLLLSRPSNLQNFDLNGSGQVLSSSLNMQNHHDNHEEVPKTQEIQEFGARHSFYSSIPNGHVAQYVSTSTTIKKFMNEQAHPSLDPLTAAQMVSGLQSVMPIQPNPLVEQKNQILFEHFSPMSGDGIEPEGTHPSGTVAHFIDSAQSKETPGKNKLQQHEISGVSEPKEQGKPAFSELEQRAPAFSEGTHKGKDSTEDKIKEKENGDGLSKVENGSDNKEDKDLRLFKNALVESVKEILKPTWKLGKMSRDVHKTIVKKVVDKVTSTIQADHIPKTQDKIDQYLSHSKTKISKLVQAYVDRHLKTDS